MKRGDFVKLTYGGKTVRAMVLLASPNEASVMLGFDGALVPPHGEGMFVGHLPVLKGSDGIYRDILCQQPATIEPEEQLH